MKYPQRNYHEFTVDEFVLDPFFKEWVIQSSPEMDEFWMDWKAVNPTRIEILEEARKVVLALESSQFSLNEEEIKAVWSGVQSDIKKSQSLQASRGGKNRWGYAVAGCIAVLLAVGLYWRFFPKENVYLTGFGETLEILLPDSSMVTLNANSRLTFNNDWDAMATREIWIEGEAFFRVKHMEDHQPFKVWSSKGIAIEVLGTEFNVYNRSEETEVVLNSGVVSLSFPVNKREGKILMQPGEMVQFKDSKIEKKQVDTALYTSWKDEVLYLDQTSLSQIVNMARTNYGIEIEVKNKQVLELTASGSMPLTDANEFMKQIALLFNIEILKEENKYLIK